MRIWISAVLSLTFYSAACAAGSMHGWLHSDSINQASPGDEVCVTDPLHMASNEKIERAIAELGLGGESISFLGCTHGRFATHDDDDGYIVHYKLQDGSSPRILVLPLLHELSHVMQYKAYGSHGDLTKALCYLRIEIGADFVAGLIYRRIVDGPSPVAYHESLELLGEYAKERVDPHGSPEQRTIAFRAGFFFRRPRIDGYEGVEGAHRYFQDEMFADLIAEPCP